MFASRTSWKLAPNRLSLALAQLRSSKRKIFDLTASNPTRVGLQYDHQLIAASLAPPEILEYSPQPKGLLRGREAVVEYYRSRGDETPDPERIILTTSTSEGYSFIFRLLCEPGDEVLVPAPSYPLFEYLASLQDVKPIHYQLFYDHGWHVDLHSLEKAVTPRTRAIVLVNPNNPTGSYVADSAKQAINELCLRQN